MKIVLAADHAGFSLKEFIKGYLAEKGIVYEDFGTFDEESVDYPDLAFKAARAVQQGNFARGILVCGTGIGVAIVANKLPGIRAALCNDLFSARYARAHNDANILTLGSRVLQKELAREIVGVFLETPFEGGRHQVRVEKIKELEERAREIDGCSASQEGSSD
ncbi:MAG: ribose 5-phosphate isomerase B [Dethiobacteria bacterium]